MNIDQELDDMNELIVLLRIEKVFKKENPFQGDILSMTTYF
jgi:hypothetical protein